MLKHSLRVSLFDVPVHPPCYGGWRARLRRWCWLYIRRYHSELCQQCGGPYRETAWGTTDRLWAEVVGPGIGLLCPNCFDALATDCGIFIKWRPMVLARRDEQGRWDRYRSEDRDDVENLYSMRTVD